MKDPVLAARAFEHWRRALPATQTPTLDDLRAAAREFAGSFPIPDGVEVVETAGGLDVVDVDQAPRGVVLHVHGGGYVLGAPEDSAELAARLALASGARFHLVRYGQAPERPHPGPLDDVLSAYRTLVAQHGAANVAVVAESAGAGLALAALLAARDIGDPLPAAIVLFSPWVDLTLSARSLDANASVDPIISRDALQMMAGLYLAGADTQDPRLAILGRSLAGLPPTLVQVGSREGLFDDARRFADEALAGGVDVRLEVEDGMPHVYQYFGSFLPEAQDAIARAGAFLRTVLS